MSVHEARISKNSDGMFYALVVRIDKDGRENVLHGYKGRHFMTHATAALSTARYIEKISR